MASVNHNVVAFMLSQRLRRVERLPHQSAWKLWLDTSDYQHGTFMMLHDSGMIERVTVWEGEGDETIMVRPSDAVLFGVMNEVEDDG